MNNEKNRYDSEFLKAKTSNYLCNIEKYKKTPNQFISAQIAMEILEEVFR